MKVLVSAYACEPGGGSEPGIGWNWARQSSRFDETWVITRSNNRARIEQRVIAESLSRLNFVYYDTPRFTRFWKKGQRGIHAYYYLWQVGAYFVAKQLHRQVGFDRAHHVTLGAYWKPSFLAFMSIPFIWGPVGGGESTPGPMRSSFSITGRLRELGRDFAHACGRIDPLVRLTARRARLAIATTADTEQRIRDLGATRTVILSHVGLPVDEIRRLGRIPDRHCEPFRIVSVGRLLHWKGYELGIRAFAHLIANGISAQYYIVGHGPEQKKLKQLARAMGVREQVVFTGSLSRAEAIERIAQCNVLLHPSLHDSGAWVCAEAMAAGRPVVCLDCGGPGVTVTAETGIKVPPNSPQQCIHDLGEALVALASDRDLYRRMSASARRRVHDELNWDRKGEYLRELQLAL